MVRLPRPVVGSFLYHLVWTLKYSLCSYDYITKLPPSLKRLIKNSRIQKSVSYCPKKSRYLRYYSNHAFDFKDHTVAHMNFCRKKALNGKWNEENILILNSNEVTSKVRLKIHLNISYRKSIWLMGSSYIVSFETQ